MLHKNIPLGSIHYIHNWEVANAAALAALSLVATDRGKLAWQLDTNEFFFLANHVGPVWVGALGVGGPIGPAGLSVLNGVVAPVAGVGIDGEFYIDTITKTLYGPKAAGAWPAGVSLVGPAGPQGIQGIQGIQGVIGNTGATGANGLGVPIGGAINTVLTKASAADNDTVWTTPSSGGRELLTANRTYYVATTGSDSNNGLAVGTPFLTIQKAVDIISGTLDIGIYDVTIQIADGTYTASVLGKLLTGAGKVIIKGNTATPANVLISTTSATCFYIAGAASRYDIIDMKLQTTTSGSGIHADVGAQVGFGNINFGAIATIGVRTGNGARAFMLSSYTISGGGSRHVTAGYASSIHLNGAFTITITGTPAFSGGFADISMNSLLYIANITLSGTITGLMYTCATNSVIMLNAKTLPGVSSSTTTGGQVIN